MTAITDIALFTTGGVVGTLIYRFVFTREQPSIKTLEHELVACKSVLEATDAVITDTQAREITERANDAVSEYKTEMPITIEHSESEGADE